MQPILRYLLETKRPTNNPLFCLTTTIGLLDMLNIKHEVDAHGNVTVNLGGHTSFTSHTDTVDNKLGHNHLDIDEEGGMVTVKNGGVLGADDGAGMYVMIRMILAAKPGYYVFFATEEQGRVGSSKYDMPAHIKKCVSFDRKGYDNLITHQMGEPGCSDAFANAFIASFDLPYVKDPTGSYTDSYTYFTSVPECVNLSVGYFDQHTKFEALDFLFLEELVDACITLDWEALPVERDPHAIAKWYDMDYPHTASSSKLEDFVYDNPEIVVQYLEEMGITVEDLMRYDEEGYEQYSIH